MASIVKQEIIPFSSQDLGSDGPKDITVVDLSSSSDSDSDSDGDSRSPAKKPRFSYNEEGFSSALPLGFLEPLSPEEHAALLLPAPSPPPNSAVAVATCRQFWKAGEYDGDAVGDSELSASGGMDHVRVHPKFLHSNATSHKWALGAFAELLDNSLDEVCHGATYVSIDALENKKDKSRMLVVEDNGGGMNPDKMRQCMSLGYSVKSKLANAIGQYGNGFKTSTMRLGADVIVFSRCFGKDGKSPTQSIGMLSYTFLRSTRKEDIVVPMVDYELEGKAWKKLIRSSQTDWKRNIETIVQWSPYSTEADLLLQFNSIKDQGTRIIIYNLWENDQGKLELDFSADQQDIQLRGVNRDEKKIQMAKEFPNSRHFLTYQHSLRSYASILYLRPPPCFRIILRGKDVEYHNIVNDMMLKQQVTYRPQAVAEGIPKDPNMVAEVTIGFVKDAKHHIDVQGFNVYHKNRLIKPFWRVWNAAGSDGRGVIGVLEANFVEPAHDKQGFERTTVLARLEVKLTQMQKNYWSTNCHKVGYAPRRNKKQLAQGSGAESSPQDLYVSSSGRLKNSAVSTSVACKLQKSRKSLLSDKWDSRFKHKLSERIDPMSEEPCKMGSYDGKGALKFKERLKSLQSKLHESSPAAEDDSDEDFHGHHSQRLLDELGVHNSSPRNKSLDKDDTFSSSCIDKGEKEQYHASKGVIDKNISMTWVEAVNGICNGNSTKISNSNSAILKQLEAENAELKEQIKKLEQSISLQVQSERDENKLLEAQVHELELKLEVANKEQEALIDVFSEERSRRDREEDILRKKLKDASATIQELLEKVTSNT